jgi:hypothetical protein
MGKIWNHCLIVVDAILVINLHNPMTNFYFGQNGKGKVSCE